MFYAGLSTGHQTYQTKPSELACKYYHWQFHKHYLYTLVRYLYIHTVSAKYPFNVCNILFIWMKMGSKWNFFLLTHWKAKKKYCLPLKVIVPKCHATSDYQPYWCYSWTVIGGFFISIAPIQQHPIYFITQFMSHE